MIYLNDPKKQWFMKKNPENYQGCPNICIPLDLVSSLSLLLLRKWNRGESFLTERENTEWNTFWLIDQKKVSLKRSLHNVYFVNVFCLFFLFFLWTILLSKKVLSELSLCLLCCNLLNLTILHPSWLDTHETSANFLWQNHTSYNTSFSQLVAHIQCC